MKLPEAKIADRIFLALLSLQVVVGIALFFIFGKADYRTLRTILLVFLVGTGPATVGAILMDLASEKRSAKSDKN